MGQFQFQLGYTFLIFISYGILRLLYFTKNTIVFALQRPTNIRLRIFFVFSDLSNRPKFTYVCAYIHVYVTLVLI